MQTLTPTLYPCYATPDRAVARALAEFLERGANLRVFLEEGAMRSEGDLVAKARDARMADLVLILFSRHSLPRAWQRRDWEPALVEEPAAEGVRIAFAVCDDCAPPRVLAPRFDLRIPEGFRQVKRWVRGGDFRPVCAPPEADRLGAAIADRPGHAAAQTIEAAAGFVDCFRGDFDEVFHLECRGRSLAALAGDLAAQLGMRLEGELDENLERLGAFCRERRFLVVLAEVSPAHLERLVFGGRCSTLSAPGPLPLEGRERPDEIREAQHGFSEAVAAGRWPEICNLARNGVRLTQRDGRIAECYELLKRWFELAEERGDFPALDEASRQMVWILEGWGRVVEAQRLEYQRATEFGEQLALPF